MENVLDHKGIGISAEPIIGRSKLGQLVPVHVFRALRLEGMKEIAGRGANAIIYRGGRNLGYNIGQDISTRMSDPGNLNEYLTTVVHTFEQLGIGIVSVAGGSFSDGQVYLQVDECVTCAGIPNIGETVCHFEGGVVAGIIQNFTKSIVTCKEIQCWGKGDKSCVFEVKM
jgi:predicted hydrocarbon binding protein